MPRTAPYMIEPQDMPFARLPAPASKPKGHWAAHEARMAQIIAEHEARGCVCRSCTVRQSARLQGAA